MLLPDNFSMDGKDAMTLADKKIRKNLQLWSAAGVRSADGSLLPEADPVTRLVMPSGAGGQHILVYSSFDSILDWNRSNYCALAGGPFVGHAETGSGMITLSGILSGPLR